MKENSQCAVCSRIYASESDFLKGTARWRICSLGHLWFNCSCGSTLVIKRGKFPWFSPEKLLGEEAKSVFNKLGSIKDFPHVSSSTLEMQSLISRPETSLAEIATAIRREPVIAARVLQIAESFRLSRNNLTPPIQSVEHAIVYIGSKSLSDVILTSAIRSLKIHSPVFNIDEFWEESLLTGTISEVLARLYGENIGQDQAFLAGSLANIGKLVTAVYFPAVIAKMAKKVADTDKPLTWRQAEALESFPDHAIIGEIAATFWGLPDYVMVAARRHHEVPAKSPSASFSLFELVSIANQLTHLVMGRPHRVESEIIDRFVSRAKLSEESLEQLLMSLRPPLEKQSGLVS
jgi:HD-like signal output (HDOD) protein